MHVRYDSNARAVNKFIGLQELEYEDAAGVLQAVDQVLQDKAGITLDMQRQKVVNVNLDGASVNMGIYNGLAAQLQQRNGRHIAVNVALSIVLSWLY